MDQSTIIDRLLEVIIVILLSYLIVLYFIYNQHEKKKSLDYIVLRIILFVCAFAIIFLYCSYL